MRRVPKNWFARDALTTARELLGKVILYKGVGGMIVETEAYARDPASHAYRITPRSEIMQSTYGVFYIYFTYGMHHCLNITTDKRDVGAVLIRALEPLEGISVMKRRRNTGEIRLLTSGPGKLCQALGVTRKLNGTEVNEKIELYDYKKISDNDIVTTTRIGISEARELPWRFYVRGNLSISKP